MVNLSLVEIVTDYEILREGMHGGALPPRSAGLAHRCHSVRSAVRRPVSSGPLPEHLGASRVEATLVRTYG
jgi:hypothetical protein